MRSAIVMAMFLASFAGMAANDYTETRELSLDAAGVDSVFLETGAGSLEVEGVDGLAAVEATATIIVPDASERDAVRVMEKELHLTLARDGKRAVLESRFDQRFWGLGSNGRIDLAVRVPAAMAVSIDDGSGSIEVSAVAAHVQIEDGSGSIDVRDVGDLDIEDGSGSIDVRTVKGDVTIDDGSGSIEVSSVGGTVTIDDGSGSIRVSDVGGDLIIIEAGSGGVSFSDIRGTVEQEG